jgi:hypothetical protein
MIARLVVAAAVSGLAACGALPSSHPPGADSAAAYCVVDPFSANWCAAHTRLGDDLFRIDLRRKPLVSGGEGEAMPTFRRHAERLARELGYTGYLTLEFNEGIESTLPIAQRVAQGVIRFTKQ